MLKHRAALPLTSGPVKGQGEQRMSAEQNTGIAPHGGRLVNRVVPPEARLEAHARAERLRSFEVSARAASDLLLLATGAFSPLQGFMGFDAARSTAERFRLPDGMLWPFPILLQVDEDLASAVRAGERVALRYRETLLGTLQVEEKFSVPRAEWAVNVFKTAEPTHPGASAFLSAGEIALAGPIEWFGDPLVLGLDAHWLTPAQTRAEIARRGWKTVAGFQTRNPVHRAHEYVLRTALEVNDGLLLHPLVGETRAEDLPAAVRMRCYQTLLDHYLPKERVLFSVLPAWMRYAGPREAIFHALVRKNFGCTHFLVGRDHAGVGNYYGPYDAHDLLRDVVRDGLGVQPLFFDEVFYCHRCGSLASRRTCAHPPESRLILSGTEVRRMLREGVPLPPEFTRPEVAAVLAEAFQSEGGDRDA
jgi:sulfate adenylyltransferase